MLADGTELLCEAAAFELMRRCAEFKNSSAPPAPFRIFCEHDCRSMMRITTEGGRPLAKAELRGFGVYLDNFALIAFAKGPTSRRQRFVEALTAGGTLLFSWTNAIEVAGPQGASVTAVRAFLDSIGPHWVPVEMDLWAVAQREKAGLLKKAPLSENFVNAYFKDRIHDLSPTASTVVDLSDPSFFALGAVLDWVHGKRNSARQSGPEMDQALREKMELLDAEYAKDPNCLDRLLPPIPFDEKCPATYVLIHLQRMLWMEKKAYQLKANDGLDFCHAVLGAAYGSLAALDKQWKRRIESLPEANRLAKVFYAPELCQLVNLLESLVGPK